MDTPPRIDVFFDKHFGFGIRWRIDGYYKFELSIALPFVTLVLGMGKVCG